LYAANPPSSLKSVEIYLYRNDEQFGPYTVKQIQAFIDTGSFSPIDSAWFEGCGDWTTISQVPGIVISEEKLRQHLVPPFEAYVGDKPYVFVSYAHADGELVFREIKKLHEAGYRIWYDEGIEPGNDWPEHIAKAVVDCSLFLMFTSPRSAASENCRNEVNLALNRKKKFLAVYLEETELPLGLELRMGDLQSIFKFRMPETTYRKKVYQGMENLLGPDGREQPEGEDLVAEAMAVEEETDFLHAPVDASGATVNLNTHESRKVVHKLPRRSFAKQAKASRGEEVARPGETTNKDKRWWIIGGAVGILALLLLVWLLSGKPDDLDPGLANDLEEIDQTDSSVAKVIHSLTQIATSKSTSSPNRTIVKMDDNGRKLIFRIQGKDYSYVFPGSEKARLLQLLKHVNMGHDVPIEFQMEGDRILSLKFELTDSSIAVSPNVAPPRNWESLLSLPATVKADIRAQYYADSARHSAKAHRLFRMSPNIMAEVGKLQNWIFLHPTRSTGSASSTYVFANPITEFSATIRVLLKNGDAIFCIFNDNELVQSFPIKGNVPKDIQVNLGSCKKLRLVTRTGTRFNDSWALWVDPKVR
jgi:hypothetical protein